MSALGFLIAVTYVPGLFAAPVMPRWWVLAIGLPLASSLDPRRMWEPAAWCLCGAVLWAAMTVYDAPHPHAAALETFFLVLLCLAAFAGAALDDLAPALAGMSWGIAISGVLCVFQVTGWWSPLPQSSVPAGLFYNSEVLAEVAAPLLLWAALDRRWVLGAILAVPVALSGSRVALLAIAVGLVWAWKPRGRFVKAAVVIIAAFVGLAMLLANDGKIGSAITRVGFWWTALYSLTPWGRGIGWWAMSHVGPYEEFVHSDMLQAMVELGPGALLLAVLPAAALWRGAGTIAERAAYVAICVEGLVSFPLHLPAGGFLFAMLAGFLARARPVVCGAGLPGGASERSLEGWESAQRGPLAAGG